MIASDRNGQAGEIRRLAVIGGGFSGAAVVYHLARAASCPLRITLFEPRERVGRGLAYSTPGEHLLLNVPAGKLTIDPERPGDFFTWCNAAGRPATPSAFLPRAWFGEYTEARMIESVEKAGDLVAMRRVNDRVQRVHETADALSIETDRSTDCRVDHAVLALGHGPSRIPEAIAPVAQAPQVLHSPWDIPAMTQVAEHANRVLIVGAGLTTCDAAITLARLGFNGQMTAVSRRGLLPRVHGPSNPDELAPWREALRVGSLRDLLRSLRSAARSHNWRSVIDALRPITAELWSSLTTDEQKQFLARLAPYWDAHRHRMPPECDASIQQLRDSGSLRVIRGRIHWVRTENSRLMCKLTIPGEARAELLEADAIVLCTGPQPDPSRWSSTLIQGLLDNGLASIETNGLGLRTNPEGLLIGAREVVQHRLSTIGPLRRGALWESTAAPELSAQAAALGQMLAAPPKSSRTPATADQATATAAKPGHPTTPKP